MGLTWDRYIIKRYFFTFGWISLAAFGVYFSSDLLFKLQNFRSQPSLIIPYYAYRLVPFFLISMPVISFFSLVLISIQVRRRREWHIAKLICNSNFTLSRSLMICGVLLLLPWLFCRELLLPQLRDPIQQSYQLIKGQQESEPRIIRLDNQMMLIKSIQGDYQEISFQSVDLSNPDRPQLNPQQKAIWNENTQSWQTSITLKTPPPSPTELGAQRRFYLYTSMDKLFQRLSKQPNDMILKTALIERLLFFPLFAFYFFIAAYDAIRCRHIRLVWMFPIGSLFILSLSVMGFKSINMDYGWFSSLTFVITCAVITPNLFNLYFRRKHKS